MGFTLASGVIFLAIAAIIWQGFGDRRRLVINTTMFYSDDDGKTWFVDDMTRIPPFDHNGKQSTLAKVLGGVIRPAAGEVSVNGQVVHFRNALEAQRLGIGIVFQELDLFPNLTVAENIVIGNARVERSAFVNFSAIEAFCRPFLLQVGFALSPAVPLGVLSVGQMQLIAIARALSMDARVLFMDEPTSALGEEDVERLFGLIKKLTAAGVAIVYVSHKMQEIFRIADRITVMRDGSYIATRNAAQTNVRDIITMMVGRELADAQPRGSRATERLILSLNGVSTRRLNGVSFDLHAGEVLGLAGLVGAGRSEVGAALFGLDRILDGTIQLQGKPYRPRHVRDAIAAGIGLLPEDRKGQGLMMQMSVEENCTMTRLPRLSPRGLIRAGRERAATRQMLERTRIKTASYQAPVSSLSGGNQQKVLLGRWLLVDPDVLFLDDPTRGIDVGAKRDIYAIISRLADRGKGVLFVSSELPELLMNCDRIVVLHDGHVTGVVDARTATQEQIMALATHSEDAPAKVCA